MRSQSDLFDSFTRARSTDPATSHEAAEAVVARGLRDSQREVLRTIRWYGPISDGDLFPLLRSKMSPSGARTRRSELVEMGLVEDSGKTGLTESNRSTILWRAR